MSEEKDENIIDVEAAYSKTEDFLNTNQKPVLYGSGAIVAIIAAAFYYFNVYLPPIEQEAQQEMYIAQNYFAADSFQLAMYGDNAGSPGFEYIIDNYGSTDAGNTAKYYMGISLLHTGSYQDAIDFLKSYSADDELTGAIAKGAIGDAYSEMQNYEEALSSYKAAAGINSNEYSSPIYLMKAGKVAEKLQDYGTAVSMYEKIKKDYPNTQQGRTIEKYLTRAKANQG